MSNAVVIKKEIKKIITEKAITISSIYMVKGESRLKIHKPPKSKTNISISQLNFVEE